MTEKKSWPEKKPQPEPEIITTDPETGEQIHVRKEDVGKLIRKENEQEDKAQ